MKFYRCVLLLPALSICAAGAEDTALHRLTVSAESPSVPVKPQPPGRRSLALPSLDYVFRVEARCEDDWTPESLSLTVADSRIRKTGEELKNETNQQLDLKVPASQLAPLTLRDFCVIGSAPEGSAAGAGTPLVPREDLARTSRLTTNAAIAHASLRCSNGEQQKTIYVSSPLDVTLVCERPDAEDAVASP
jgi:hypothetical protein